MGAQEKTEEVLREIHVFFSKAEHYNGSKRKVIIDKNDMMDLLKKLNSCMYDMMEEHELTEQSRDKAQRKLQKKGDDILFEARKNAEDIYAASIMYSDRALTDIQDIMKEAEERVEAVHQDMMNRIREEKQQVKNNQFELKGQLQDLIDTQKYMHLIEDENARRAKAKELGEEVPSEMNPYGDIKPEIKVNADYFRATGQAAPADATESESDMAEAALSEDLDAEYFSWKEQEEESSESKEKKGFSLFGKKGDK